MKELKIKSLRQFSEELGLKGRTETITRAIKSNVLINSKLEMLIVSKFPEVSRDYLRTGEGPVKNKSDCKGCIFKQERIEDQKLLIDFLKSENVKLKERLAKLEEEIERLRIRKAI